MAALVSKASYAGPHNHTVQRTQTSPAVTSFATTIVSPTDSDFSVGCDDTDSVRTWNEDKVVKWLKSINAGQYAEQFKANNITGENLLDLDQAMLKEIGVNKIGDRVRISSQAKQFRHEEYSRRRPRHRDSLTLDQPILSTPPSSGSPRPFHSARSTPLAHNDRRADTTTTQYATAYSTSPPPVQSTRSAKAGTQSPGRAIPKELARPYLNHTASAPSAVARTVDGSNGSRPSTLSRKVTATAEQLTQNARSLQANVGPLNLEGAAAVAHNQQRIRVIYDDARVAVFTTEQCNSADAIILKTLRMGKLNEAHIKSCCFYVLDGTEANPAFCRRLTDQELMRVCGDVTRKERERLMFRKIHAGEPEGDQLRFAANIAMSHLQESQPQSFARNSPSQPKFQKLKGQSLPSIAYPMSPASEAQRDRQLTEAEEKLQQSQQSLAVPPRARPRQEGEFPRGGERPPSELVIADAETYFPENKDQVANIRRMSVRRSQRLSRAHNRLSIASTAAPSAPPVPGIPRMWLNTNNSDIAPPRARPLSIFGRANSQSSMYRDSIASTNLDPLDEESPYERRESYVPYEINDPATVHVTDPDGRTVSRSEDDSVSTSPSISDIDNSLNEQLSAVIAEDGEELDEPLNDFLKPDSFEDVKYVRGKLIGQGSYGIVYLALHAVTGELMAVKQVELPTTAGTPFDSRKNNMVSALKHEIALLRELNHKHIVRYLGTSSDADHLNIFLEYIPGGSISKMLIDFGTFGEGLCGNFVRQILQGLAYLHSKDIIHRDIKGANVLVDNHGSVKISDFGISKKVQDSKSLMFGSDGNSPTSTTAASSRTGPRAVAANRVSLQGSVFWMAPEVVRQTAYTRKADIWSLGCLVVEMLTGTHPHPTLSQLQAIFKIGGRGAGGVVNDPAPEFPEGCSEPVKEFLRSTFRVEWETRPEAHELMQYQWLKAAAV